MSKESAKKFAQEVTEDIELRNRTAKLKPEEVLPIAKEMGYDFTEEELTAVMNESQELTAAFIRNAERKTDKGLQMITVETGNAELYSLHFSEYKTAHTDQCAGEAAAGGRILLAYLDGAPAGYMLIASDRGGEGIRQIFTKPELRGQGVMQALVCYAAETADTFLAAGMSDSNVFAPVIDHVFVKN